MSVVSYNGKKLIPAPLCEINKTLQKNSSNEIIGKTYSIVLTGKILPWKGSPDSSGSFWTGAGYPNDENISESSRLKAILRKQEAVMELFAEEGKSLEIQSADGSTPRKCNPRVISINFPQGLWFTQCDYTITLEADVIYPEEDNEDFSFINDFTESWSLDTDEQAENEGRSRIYRVSHSVSAVGKRFYDEDGNLGQQPWKYAQDYVLPRLGLDTMFTLSSGVNNLPTFYRGFNHVRNEVRDESAGSFSANETWILASGSSLEEYTVETSKDQSTGLTRVGINGTITGFEERNLAYDSGIIKTKYQSALERFTLSSGLAFNKAQIYSGYSLNILPLSERIGRNPVTGTISYGYEYDNRPSNIVSGALSEVISIVDSLSTQTIAVIPVLGRARGSVKQPLGTSDDLTCQLNIEVVMPVPSFGSFTQSDLQSAFFGQRPDVSGIVRAVDPLNRGFTTSYFTTNRESWDAKTGRFTKEIVFIYE